ncbi:hypothetical protein [Streptomyces sp. NPDC093591]
MSPASDIGTALRGAHVLGSELLAVAPRDKTRTRRRVQAVAGIFHWSAH